MYDYETNYHLTKDEFTFFTYLIDETISFLCLKESNGRKPFPFKISSSEPELLALLPVQTHRHKTEFLKIPSSVQELIQMSPSVFLPLTATYY